jgi:hypothetical protein
LVRDPRCSVGVDDPLPAKRDAKGFKAVVFDEVSYLARAIESTVNGVGTVGVSYYHVAPVIDAPFTSRNVNANKLNLPGAFWM